MSDPREAERRKHEADSLSRGVCPASGLGLYPWGNAAAVSDLSCAVCDCFGYSRAEVGRGIGETNEHWQAAGREIPLWARNPRMESRLVGPWRAAQ